jgi:hypothetical protein
MAIALPVVARLPLVGRVTFVVPVTVSVVAKAPETVIVLAALFATPVPPLAGPTIPVKDEALTTLDATLT